MLRYVAIIWNNKHSGQRSTAKKLHELIHASGLYSFATQQDGLLVAVADMPRHTPLPAMNSGVILGHVFHNDRGQKIASALSDNDVTATLTTRGRHLITQYWGNYVAFMRNRFTGSTLVVKDPTGNLPCYLLESGGLTLCFSCIADILRLGIVPPRPNPAYLKNCVTIGNYDPEESPLVGVGTVHRGECIEFIADRIHKHQAWDPAGIAESGAMENPEEAAEALRQTVQWTIDCWSAIHNNALLRLSGGLDSSIVAGCAARSPGKPRIVHYTFYNPQFGLDERAWARIAVQHNGGKQIECPLNPTEIRLNAALHGIPSVEPETLMAYQGTALDKKLSCDENASAVFTGEGGDSGFCSTSIKHAASDYFSRHGLRPRILKLASAVAQYTEKSTWSVLTSTLRGSKQARCSSDRRAYWLKACQLLTPELQQAVGMNATTPPHPWFPVERLSHESTRLRLGELITAPRFQEGLTHEMDLVPETITPLYSQPVVELCLRIPTYVHFLNGRERGLARYAFKNDLPERIAKRTWKDRPVGFVEALLHHNTDFVRECLVDGILVQNGLLDKAAVERALAPQALGSTVMASEIMRHLETEVWARKWMAQQQRILSATPVTSTATANT